MDKDTLSEYLGQIKDPKYPPLEPEDELTQILFRAESLIDLITDQDLVTVRRSILHDCHMILFGLIKKARVLSETLPSASQTTPLSSPPKETPD